MTEISDTLESDFNNALARYKSGEDLELLIKSFKDIINQLPNHFAAWTCLSWLQLLQKNNMDALASARQAVKLNPQDPQARMNLALASLATNQKGVREHIDLIKRLKLMMPELENELKESVSDGLSRYPNWPELIKIKTWLDF